MSDLQTHQMRLDMHDINQITKQLSIIIYNARIMSLPIIVEPGILTCPPTFLLPLVAAPDQELADYLLSHPAHLLQSKLTRLQARLHLELSDRQTSETFSAIT
eukprot:750838-Hanusia_phi.AAC.2